MRSEAYGGGIAPATPPLVPPCEPAAPGGGTGAYASSTSVGGRWWSGSVCASCWLYRGSGVAGVAAAAAAASVANAADAPASSPDAADDAASLLRRCPSSDSVGAEALRRPVALDLLTPLELAPELLALVVAVLDRGACSCGVRSYSRRSSYGVCGRTT